jgi:2,5-furandicarboxylate decarboxylase 1
MEDKGLRDYLERLKQEAPEEIREVKRKVDRQFEASAVLARLEREKQYPAVMFHQLHQFDMPVLSNLFASRKRMALALRCGEKELNQIYREREERRIDQKS